MIPDRELLDQLPDTALLPVTFVKQLIADLHVQDEEPLADLTCEQVAQALGRRPSTIRGWLHAGELAGYKLGRQWRITREDLRAFQDRQRKKSIHNEKSKSFRAGREVDLGAWRKVRSVTQNTNGASHFPVKPRRSRSSKCPKLSHYPDRGQAGKPSHHTASRSPSQGDGFPPSNRGQ